MKIEFYKPGILPLGAKYIGAKILRRKDGGTEDVNSLDQIFIEYFDLASWNEVVKDAEGTEDQKKLPNHFYSNTVEYRDIQYSYGDLVTSRETLKPLLGGELPQVLNNGSDSTLQIPGTYTGFKPIILQADYPYDRDLGMNRDYTYDLLAVPVLAIPLGRQVRVLNSLKTLSYNIGPVTIYSYFGANLNLEDLILSSKPKYLGMAKSMSDQDSPTVSSWLPITGGSPYKYFELLENPVETEYFDHLIVVPWTQGYYLGQLISGIELEGTFEENVLSSPSNKEILSTLLGISAKLDQSNVLLDGILKK